MHPAQFSRSLAAAWLLVTLAVFFLMQVGFSPFQAAVLAVWVASPIPVGYWLAKRISRSRAAWWIVTLGLGTSFAFGAWLYWDAFLGPSSRSESLSGLIVLHGPLYQLVLVLIALCIAWLVERRGGPVTRA
jgi:hypothetical protein